MSEPVQHVVASDGVRLVVYQNGRADGPTLLALHGYPDDHGVWDGLVAALADRYHVVTYDVRGAGASDTPQARDRYRMTQLIGDLAAVLDAVSPQQPVHLVAHDWGSIQGWAALTDERLAGRIASYTSISGPSLAYGGAWLRRLREHPRSGLRQLAHSYYVGVFLLPWLPEFAIRRGIFDRLVRRASRARVAPERAIETQLAGLALYRANISVDGPAPIAVPAGLPVQLIVPERDPFVTPDFAVGASTPWVPKLTVRRVDGGHWVLADKPDLVAAHVAEFVAGHATA